MSVDLNGGKQEQPVPRVLVITAFPLSAESASGQMMRNLLFGWPRAQLGYLNVGVGGAADETSLNARWEPGIFGKVAMGVRRLRGAKVGSGTSFGVHPRGGRLLKAAAQSWLELIPIRLGGGLERWIGSLEPEVIYTWLGTPAIHDFVHKISNRWKVPTVVHVMDDWIASKYLGNWLAGPSRRALVRSFEREIGAAGACIAIGDKMAAAYRQRYGREFDVISNSVDLARFPKPPAGSSGAAGGPRHLKIGHLGRLTGGRLESLIAVEAALQILAGRGIQTSLELLGTSPESLPRPLRGSPLISCDLDVSDDRVRRLGSEADAFLQIESFNRMENDWFRLSLSAKLPLYLALGRPVVAYGPPYLGSIEYVAECRCGIVIAKPGAEGMARALQRLVDSPAERETMGRRARELAETRHDRIHIGEHLAGILTRAAQAGGAHR